MLYAGHLFMPVAFRLAAVEAIAGPWPYLATEVKFSEPAIFVILLQRARCAERFFHDGEYLPYEFLPLGAALIICPAYGRS
jgi:hypothetical protein